MVHVSFVLRYFCFYIGWWMMSSSSSVVTIVVAWVTTTPVSQLLQQHAIEIAELRNVVQTFVNTDHPTTKIDMNSMPYNNDIYYLRYCIVSNSNKKNDNDDSKTKLRQSLQWRTSEQGQRICTLARTAVSNGLSLSTTTKGTDTKSTSWTNQNQENVFNIAPSASKIGQYLTPINCITTSLTNGDLVYCIRAGAIQDVELFKVITMDEMIDFFLFVKEIHALVSDIRSTYYNQLLYTITCNDLSNVKLLGGSSEFRTALSKSSNIASKIIYPSSYSGPTLLCNLPIVVSALVQLFTPLFPETVKERLKFVQGPLSNVNNLQDIATSSSTNPKRTEFIQQVNDILAV